MSKGLCGVGYLDLDSVAGYLDLADLPVLFSCVLLTLSVLVGPPILCCPQ